MIIKKIAAISASMLILFSATALGSDIYTVYDLTQEVRLGTGITYEKIEKYTSKGWMNINVIRADLNDEYTKVEPVTNEKGVSNRTTLSTMLKSAGAVAGVNGDFFYMGDPTYTYGALIKNGNLITSPLPYSYGYPTISRLLNGAVDISIWNPKITLYGTDNTLFNVVVYNKTSSLDWGPTILTTDWNDMSVGYSEKKDIVEVVVVDNIVSEVRKNKPSITIPKEGFIIASSNPTTMEQLVNSFTPGNPISLNIELDLSPDETEWAFGGLNYLVKDGQLNEISDEVLGTHPRTAIGFNRDDTEMILVTIDGRNKDYVGVKQTELAQIMMELGAYNIINMDGGGSTTMGIDFLRNSNITIVNMPSDGKERKIASSVGIFNTAPESDKVDTIEIIPTEPAVFNNTELTVDLKFYNEYAAPIDTDINKVAFKVSPSNAGKVVNNKFIPSKPGKAVITASVKDAEGSVEINVLDEPVALKFNTDSLTLDYGDTYDLGNIIGIDQYGNSASIPSNYINYTYRNRVGKVQDGIFTAGDVGNTGAITASFGDAIKNIQVKVGYRYKTLLRFEDLENLKLTLYPEGSEGNIQITDNFVKEGNNALQLDYDFTKMTDQSIAFINFGKDGEGIKLEEKPKAIGMWVYGDGKNHWLRCRITDAYGTQTKLTFEDEVDWTGWEWVTADIPEGIAYPVTLKNIYLAEINETRKDSGTIYIDNLRLMYEPKDKNLGLRQETVFNDLLKVTEINDFSEKLTVTDNKKELVNKDGDVVINGDIIYFDGIISNGSMVSTDKTMWNNIKSFVNYEGKTLILTMNGSLDNIYDEREIKILKDILEKASAKNNVFVVWEGEEESSFIENGIRYVTYDDSFEICLSGNGPKYKN